MADITSLVYIDSTGYHYADFPSFLAFYTTAYQAIYGVDVYLGSDSMDGQFIGLLAQAAFDMASVGASVYNSFSPQTAQGTGLSNVVQINGIQRNVSTNSSAQLVIVGQGGTSLVNAIAIDTLQQQWAIPNTLIPSIGTVTVSATAVATGAVAALPNTITGIFTPILGWQSVNNPAAAAVGAGIETDAALRVRQGISVANPSVTAFEGTLGAVANVPGVSEYAGYENDTDITDANGLPPHSISIVVNGDYTNAAVAAAIQLHKTPGTNTYGNISVPTTDSQGVPLTINFFAAVDATIGVQVTINPLTTFNASYEALIQTAVSNYIAGLPIGSDIVITQLYSVAYLFNAATGQAPQGLTYTISGIQLSKNGGGLAASDIQLLFNELPICASGNVSIIT